MWESNPPPTCLEPDAGFEVREAHRDPIRLRVPNYPSDQRKECTTAATRTRYYNTNRGHNSITMYAIDPDTGKLEVIGWQSTRGEWPRGMNIDPSGTFLYAANHGHTPHHRSRGRLER